MKRFSRRVRSSCSARGDHVLRGPRGRRGRRQGRQGSSRGQGGHVRVGRHAPRLDGEVRQGRGHADLQEADEGRRHRRQRHAPGVPAQHRGRLVHDGDGDDPSEHGSTNNTFHPGRRLVRELDLVLGAGILQADTIADAAERAGKKVAPIDWVGGASAGINGPTVDFATFYNNRGVLVGAADPVEQAGAAAFGTIYNVGAVATASGWTGVPTGDPAATPKETLWSIPTAVGGA